MTIGEATARVLLGESLDSIAAGTREAWLRRDGLDPRSVPRAALAPEISGFMRQLCRNLGERHGGSTRVLAALRDWTAKVTDYDAWDALLTHFEFDSKPAWIARGRLLFPGSLTAHWTTANANSGDHAR